jgi:hypothetical protein
MKDPIISTDAIDPSLNNWHRIQTIRRQTLHRIHPPRIIHHRTRNRRVTAETPLVPQDTVDSNNSCYKFENEKTVWGNSPEAINERSIYRHYGGNINGLKPFGEHPDLISGLKNLRRLQAGGINLIETNIKWEKYDYRANTEKLLRNTFGSTNIAYSTSDEHVEESHYTPGGTVTAALGHWAIRVLQSGKDPTGCGRWSYICLGNKNKKFAIVTVYRVGHNHDTGDATAFQQQYRTQYADETARVEINPHKQTMIDLEYFTEKLKTDGFEVAMFIDANETLKHRARSQNHGHNYKLDKGLHIDGSIDGSIATYTRNCGLSNTLSKRHSETGTVIPKTHLRGSKQTDFVLTTDGIAPFIQAIGLLDFDVVFRTDHWALLIDINMDEFSGSPTETLPSQRLRQLQLEDPQVATAYRKALHQQFIHHSIFCPIKEQPESSKSGEWNRAQESTYEPLDRNITRAMMHAEWVCLLKHKHNTPWSPAIGSATSSIRYWDLRIKRGGIRDKNDALLDY